MKHLLIAMVLVLNFASVHAADKKLTDADAKDVVVATVYEETKYVLKKNGDKLEVIHHEQEKPFLRVKHHGKAAASLEKDVKTTLNDHRKKMAASSDDAPATLYQSKAGERYATKAGARAANAVDNWIDGAATHLAPVAHTVGIFGQLASIFM